MEREGKEKILMESRQKSTAKIKTKTKTVTTLKEQTKDNMIVRKSDISKLNQEMLNTKRERNEEKEMETNLNKFRKTLTQKLELTQATLEKTPITERLIGITEEKKSKKRKKTKDEENEEIEFKPPPNTKDEERIEEKGEPPPKEFQTIILILISTKIS